MQDFLRFGVGAAALESKRALGGGGEEIGGFHCRWIEEASALETGGGEDDGVVLAFPQLAQARVDVAAQGLNVGVGIFFEQLAAAAEAGGADSSAGECERLGEIGHHQHIPGIFPRGDGGNDEAGLIDQGHGDGHVFVAVNSEIDLIIEQGLFEFLGEESFTTGFIEGAVGDAVAGGLDETEFDVEIRPMLHELIRDELALGTSEKAGAGAETERG